MEDIILSDDDLKTLEKRFGTEVRRMGSWNSDGVFSYSSVPLVAVRKAIESLDDPASLSAVQSLAEASEPSKLFLDLLQAFGPPLIERVGAVYRETAVELLVRTRRPPQQEAGRGLVMTALA